MQIPEEAKEVVKIARQKKGVIGVYLFGSVARAQKTSRSDIDICIIPEKKWYGTDKIIEISAKAAINVDVVSFYRLPIQIRYRVFREGRSLYEKDRDKITRIMYNTVHDYLEMKPMLDRIYNAILKGRRKHG